MSVYTPLFVALVNVSTINDYNGWELITVTVTCTKPATTILMLLSHPCVQVCCSVGTY